MYDGMWGVSFEIMAVDASIFILEKILETKGGMLNTKIILNACHTFPNVYSLKTGHPSFFSFSLRVVVPFPVVY